MTFHDYMPVIVTVSLILGFIIATRVFFTLWGPIDRKINGDKLNLAKAIQIGELKDKRVAVHLKSEEVLQDVVLLGYCSTHNDAPYQFKQLLMVERPDKRKLYIRVDEISYLEEPA